MQQRAQESCTVGQRRRPTVWSQTRASLASDLEHLTLRPERSNCKTPNFCPPGLVTHLALYLYTVTGFRPTRLDDLRYRTVSRGARNLGHPES